MGGVSNLLDWLVEGWTNNEWILEVTYTHLLWYFIDIQGGGNVGMDLF